MYSKKFDTSVERSTEDILGFIREIIQQSKVKPNEVTKTELVCEEALAKLKANMTDDPFIKVSLKHTLFGTSIEMEAAGKRITSLESGDINTAVKLSEDSEEDSISTLILRAYGDRFKYVNKDGLNRIRIEAQRKSHSSVYYTLLSLGSGILVGLILRFLLPEAVGTAAVTYVLSPIKRMFMNALNIIVGPVIFFSIITCISQFSSLVELGKIGAKVMVMYVLTTVFAVFVGFFSFTLLSPGKFGVALGNVTESVVLAATPDAVPSIFQTIMDIVPSNLFRPFLESNTLQIIFLAIFLGMAVSSIGSYSKTLREILEACNELFLALTKNLSRLIPIVIFSAMVIIITQTGTESVLTLIPFLGTSMFGYCAMMLIYCILMFLFARLSPLTFFKKGWHAILNALTLSSSNAAMPTTMQVCKDRLGISQKICGFSIPLGATINMDGACIHIMISVLFLAKVYGVTIPSSSLFSLFFTIVILSLGAPGVPGASLVMMGIVLNQVGVSIEAIGFIMGVDAILDMFSTANNVVGDMVVSLIVAKWENLLDMKVFKSK